MQNVTSSKELKEAILLLENKQLIQKQQLKKEFQHILENLNYFNLIKNAFSQVTTSPGLINNVINTTLGLIAGYFSKKIFVGDSGNILKKFFGIILQSVMTYVVSKNSEGIKSAIMNFLKIIFNFQPKADTNT